MSFKYRYIKTKGNRFIWTDSNHYKLVFSNPTVQAIDDYVLLDRNERERILYYYYTMSVYKRDEYLTKGKWRVFKNITTHDAPSIVRLEYILGYLLNDDDITKNYQRHTLIGDGGEHFCTFSKMLDTGSHIIQCDDIYELNKCYNTYSKTFYYDLSVGARDELIKVCNLKHDDIYSLYACVKDFIEYSIQTHNDMNTLRFELSSKQCKCIDGSLYRYRLDWKAQTVTECVESVFYVGDTLRSLKVLFEGVVSKETSHFDGSKIVAIYEDSFKVEDTCFGETSIVTIPIDKVAYISK